MSAGIKRRVTTELTERLSGYFIRFKIFAGNVVKFTTKYNILHKVMSFAYSNKRRSTIKKDSL